MKAKAGVPAMFKASFRCGGYRDGTIALISFGKSKNPYRRLTNRLPNIWIKRSRVRMDSKE
jgi:hypothetical protein